MQIRCSQCAAAYEVAVPDKPRHARCEHCGAVMRVDPPVIEEVPVVEPPHASSKVAQRAARERDRRRASGHEPPRLPRRPRSAAAIVLGVLLLLLAGLEAMLGLSRVAVAAAQETTGAGTASVMAFGHLGLAGALVLAGLGLVFGQAWGWWLSMVLMVGGLLYFGRLYFALRSVQALGRPGEGAGELLLLGIPMVVMLAVAVGLVLPGVRLACGISSSPHDRHRRRPR
jgi:hypothetical protein